MPTLFEKIIAGELPAAIVHKDDRVTAFRDIRPVEEGIADNGYRLIVNCNAHGGQEVYHLHVHLIGGRPLGPMVLRT